MNHILVASCLTSNNLIFVLRDMPCTLLSSMTTILLLIVVQYLTICCWSCFLPFAKIDFVSAALTCADFSLSFANQRVGRQLEMGKMGPLAIQPFEIYLFFPSSSGLCLRHCQPLWKLSPHCMPGQKEEKELIACCSCSLVPNHNAVRNFYFVS